MTRVRCATSSVLPLTRRSPTLRGGPTSDMAARSTSSRATLPLGSGRSSWSSRPAMGPAEVAKPNDAVAEVGGRKRARGPGRAQPRSPATRASCSCRRYIARPPIAQERLELTTDGRCRYNFRHAWKNGVHAVLFDPPLPRARCCDSREELTDVRSPSSQAVRIRGPAGGHEWICRGHLRGLIQLLGELVEFFPQQELWFAIRARAEEQDRDFRRVRSHGACYRA
jgi:hypothetical protein